MVRIVIAETSYAPGDNMDQDHRGFVHSKVPSASCVSVGKI
jgi:hypothetical protein